MRRQRGIFAATLPGVVTVAVLLGAWELASFRYPASFLPGIEELWDRIVGLFAQDPRDRNSTVKIMGTTLWRVLAGLGLSMVIGMALGMAMGLRKHIESFAAGWVMVLLAFPAIGWAFLGMLWFGLETWVPVFVVVLVTVPFVALNAWSGTKAMDKELLDMSRAFGAGRRLEARAVLLPQVMPFFFSSLRLAFAVSWKIVLIGEAFGIPGGVGRQLADQFTELRADMVLAWAVPFMAIMLLIELVFFRRLEKRVFGWRRPLGA